MKTKKVREPVPFKLIYTPCCRTLLCFINHRMPNYCSECGERLLALKKNPEAIIFSDDNAWLEHEEMK